jgi:RNA polymerase sigma-70 factor (ECF subfamily)
VRCAELAQDALAEAWLGRARFEGDLASRESVGAWLRGIAFRVHQSARRKRRPVEPLPEQVPALEQSVDPHRSALLDAIDGLESKQRAVVLMHYLDEVPVRTTAALLGVPEKTVEGRLYRARKALRERLTAVAGPVADRGRSEKDSGDGAAFSGEEVAR